MRIEFDPAKDSANEKKHGVLVWIDHRFDSDEWRMIALAPMTGILYYVGLCGSW